MLNILFVLISIANTILLLIFYRPRDLCALFMSFSFLFCPKLLSVQNRQQKISVSK